MILKPTSFPTFSTVLFTFSFLFFLNTIVLKASTGDNDTVSVSPFSTKLSFEKQISILKTMNENQLNELVGQLMKMDSIPSELLAAINIATCNINQKENENETLSLFSSTELYEGWCADKLFSEYNTINKPENIRDTTFTFVLGNEEHNTYKHPFNGPITSSYGWRKGTMHKGVDIDLLKGDTVSAAFDGIVRYAKRGGGYGNVVIVRHFNGLETVYAHLSKINVVPDQYVSAGDLIGLGGSTGHSTGAHLHFEVRLKGMAINPKYLISFAGQSLVSNEFIIKKSKLGITAYTKNSKFYTVAKGDNIYVIAKKFGLKTTYIREMNNLFTKHVYLKPGQQICIGYINN